MTINYLAIILLTIVSFVGGSVWFSQPLFGKFWMKIHGANMRSPEELKIMMKDSKIFMAVEFFLTLVLNYILYLIVFETVTISSALTTTSLLWLGFVLPTTISTVIWGMDAKRWMIKKIAISSIYRLVMMLLAAWIFFIW